MKIKLVIAIAQDVQMQLFAQNAVDQMALKEIQHKHVVFVSLQHGIMAEHAQVLLIFLVICQLIFNIQ
jgi:hypothetical protein